MHRAGIDTPPETAGEWASLVLGLTPDYPDDEPWQLVVDDITKPAFMQPPASSKAKEKDYKSSVATPDELDMLVTSKNHDLKAAVAVQASADDWVFALVTLQTMEGFGGSRQLRHFANERRAWQPARLQPGSLGPNPRSPCSARHRCSAGVSPGDARPECRLSLQMTESRCCGLWRGTAHHRRRCHLVALTSSISRYAGEYGYAPKRQASCTEFAPVLRLGA